MTFYEKRTICASLFTCLVAPVAFALYLSLLVWILGS
jgi:hypothetical protein